MIMVGESVASEPTYESSSPSENGLLSTASGRRTLARALAAALSERCSASASELFACESALKEL